MKYSFELNEKEVNLVMNSLAIKPYNEVYEFIEKIKTEVEENGKGKTSIILDFTENELNVIINALAMRPYAEVFQFISKIQELVLEQNASKQSQ